MRASRLASWLGAALVLFYATATPAFHTLYSYRVDRFEADGNRLGDFDGVPDVVDEFDAPPLDPLWYTAAGTVSEADGYLVLSSPGLHFPAPDGGPELDMSVAGGLSILSDGYGDFSGTTYWEGILPAVNQHYYVALFTYVGPLADYAEVFGVGLRRTETAVQVEQAYTELNRYGTDYRNSEFAFHAIDPAGVSGRIGFRLSFDDATNLVTTAFSLDGGTTWQSPFAPHLMFQGRYQAQFILAADPRIDPVLPTSTTTSTIFVPTTTSTSSTTLPPPRCSTEGCRRSIVPFKGRLGIRRTHHYDFNVRWAWKEGQATALEEFPDPFTTTGPYEFCLGDAQGNLLFVTAPAYPATCCWKAGNHGYEFDPMGGYGTISQMELRAGPDGVASVSVRAPGLYPLQDVLPLELPVTARLQASNGECWAETFWPDGVRKNGKKQFIGRPGSPGAAFLD